MRNLAQLSAQAAHTTTASITESQQKAGLGVEVAQEVTALLNMVASVVQINNALLLRKTALETFLETIAADVQFLASTPPIAGIMRALARDGYDEQGHSSLEEWRKRLEVILSGFLAIKPHYLKARYLLWNGAALVATGGGNGNGPRAHGQDEVQEDYFRETLSRRAGELYISPMRLAGNPHGGGHGTTPVMRFATPVHHVGEAQALLVLDVSGERLLGYLEADDQHDIYLVNEDGFFLMHPNPEQCWGFQRGREDCTLRRQFPEHHAELQSGAAGLIQAGDQMIAYAPLNARGDGQRPWLLMANGRGDALP